MSLRALSPSDLLELWDAGPTRPPLERALLVLSVAFPEKPVNDLAELTVSDRDAILLSVHELTFGPRLDCVSTCPGCGEPLELALDTTDIQFAAVSGRNDESEVIVGNHEIRFRLPNSQDLIDVAFADVPSARRKLFERCVVAARCGEDRVSASELPEEVVAAVAELMSDAGPQADVQLSLTCPECQSEWLEDFDIVSFLWSEIGSSADRLLHDIHDLASVHGWREADILAMSPMRRQRYLEMSGG